MNKLEAYQGKRLRFWTADENGTEIQRIGALSLRKDKLRLDWEEHFPKGNITYFKELDDHIISTFELASADSGADFDYEEILVRHPRK